MFLSRKTGISGNFVGRIKGAKCPFADPAVTPDAEDKNARETAAGPEAQDEAAGPEPENGPAGTGSSEVIYVIWTESAEPESTPEVISDVL